MGSLYHSDTFGINYRSISTTLASLVENVSGAPCVFSWKSLPWKPRYNPNGMFLFMFSVINYRPIIETYIACSACECCGLYYFHENTSNGSRDTDQIARCSSCAAPLITDLSQKYRLQRMRVLRTILFSWKPLQWKPRYWPNCTLLFTCSATNYWPITEISLAAHACVTDYIIFMKSSSMEAEIQTKRYVALHVHRH